MDLFYVLRTRWGSQKAACVALETQHQTSQRDSEHKSRCLGEAVAQAETWNIDGFTLPGDARNILEKILAIEQRKCTVQVLSLLFFHFKVHCCILVSLVTVCRLPERANHDFPGRSHRGQTSCCQSSILVNVFFFVNMSCVCLLWWQSGLIVVSIFYFSHFCLDLLWDVCASAAAWNACLPWKWLMCLSVALGLVPLNGKIQQHYVPTQAFHKFWNKRIFFVVQNGASSLVIQTAAIKCRGRASLSFSLLKPTLDPADKRLVASDVICNHAPGDCLAPMGAHYLCHQDPQLHLVQGCILK